jgi:predicted RNase H-like HicB family nuclease
MSSISLSAVLSPDASGGYLALCPELDVASQGDSIEEAMRNLKEAVEGPKSNLTQSHKDTKLSVALVSVP